MFKSNQLIVIVLIILSIGAKAQDKVLYGVVHTMDSIPLIGVEVKVKSTKQSVYTDSLGQFAVAVNNEDKIKVTAEGFYPENAKIKTDVKLVAINLRLKPGTKNEQYAIGYGYVSEADRTTAVNNLSNKETRFSRYNTVYEIIESMGAEVQGGQVVIRGTRSFQGSSAALIVIDDVISDSQQLATLSPLDVKDINIIKDGSSAVYGARGANGVVLVTTKKGGEK
jgi:TonB-dependent SusC/RagA subfamily outer membrane receptor